MPNIIQAPMAKARPRFGDGENASILAAIDFALSGQNTVDIPETMNRVIGYWLKDQAVALMPH